MSEQNQRETKEVKVGVHTLVLHTYITGREAREIEGALIDDLEIKRGGDDRVETSALKGSQLKVRQDFQVKAVVVSLDQSTENVLDRILDLPLNESEEIMDHVRQIADPKKEVAGSAKQ